jgi:hypothetical protein
MAQPIGTDSTTRSSPFRGRLSHSGKSCGPRLTCWNPECRATFGSYRTLEVKGLKVASARGDDRVRIALHEAAHAVVGHALGWRVRLIVVGPHPASTGAARLGFVRSLVVGGDP